jgi:hypothetical protein
MCPGDEQAAMIIRTTDNPLDPGGAAIRLQIVFVGQTFND